MPQDELERINEELNMHSNRTSSAEAKRLQKLQNEFIEQRVKIKLTEAISTYKLPEELEAESNGR